MDIHVEDPGTADIAQLLREHLEDMHRHSPPESVHALDLDGLRKPDVTFWSVRQGPVLLGCGALKQLEPSHGEIKSMRTVTAHLRKGVAARMLAHILDEARRRAYRRLSLETGSMDAFLPARRLYERHGFRYCGPFGDYAEDPYSVFMTREL
jgi:putative acetyltransferase